MKRIKMNYSKLLLALLATAFTFSFAQSADEVLEQIVNSQRGGQTSSATITMQVIRPNKTTDFQIKSVSDGDERSLIQVVAPNSSAGQAFLQDGDNLYLYNPRLKRTLRLPPSNQNDSFLGSDVSYSDLGGDDLQDNYTPEITNQDDATIELTLTPKELAPTPYGKIVLTADVTNNYRPISYVYYDQRDTVVKQTNFSNYVEVEGNFFPSRSEFLNLTAEGEQTVIEFQDLKFGVDVDQNCFKESALERGCNN
ncbi:MAG: outer membrane lipoprotein-sorting protein [Trueperaceae bacterium]